VHQSPPPKTIINHRLGRQGRLRIRPHNEYAVDETAILSSGSLPDTPAWPYTHATPLGQLTSSQVKSSLARSSRSASGMCSSKLSALSPTRAVLSAKVSRTLSAMEQQPTMSGMRGGEKAP